MFRRLLPRAGCDCCDIANSNARDAATEAARAVSAERAVGARSYSETRQSEYDYAHASTSGADFARGGRRRRCGSAGVRE